MNRWLIWQLADSAFPSGGFAHSGGMEAAWQHGVMHDGESLRAFIGSALRQVRRGVMGYVRDGWESPEGWGDADLRCDLFLNNHVANRASRAQGRAFVAAAAGIFEHPPIAALSRSVRQRAAGHLAPVFGVVCNYVGLDLSTTNELFGFIFLRSQISVAVRLGIVGPIQGQRLQAQLCVEGAPTGTTEPVQISPILDLVQGTQDRLYSRLFQS